MAKPDPPRCAAAVSTRSGAADAWSEACDAALGSLTARPDLVFVFLSPHHAAQAEFFADCAARQFATPCVLGCTAEAVVGPGREIERQPAVAVWLARLPHTTLLPIRLSYQQTLEGGSFVGWPDALPTECPSDAAIVLLADPFSFPADLLLERLNEDQPGIPVVGGMASGASQPGGNRLLFGPQVHREGCVAVYVQGGIRLQTLVSQGCRPIGTPFVVTKAEGNVIHQLGGAPAYQRLHEVYQTLATREQRMVERGLHLGRVVNEYQAHFEQGDFLVRNVIGADAERGAIAIGDYVRPGQTVQFHVRDAETADAELRQLLAKTKRQEDFSPHGALLFTCNGRGTRLFSEPHHDAGAVERAFGKLPLAGFFAAGELGPIGGRGFLHGFTASIVFFAS